MKKIAPWAVLTILAASIFAAWSYGLIPTYQEVCNKGPHDAEKNCATYHFVFATLIRAGNWFEGHGEAIIAAFTVILGIATWLLWRSTSALVKGAEETAERQLRAYIFIADAKTSSYPRITITFKNCGQTPAYDVFMSHEMTVQPYPDISAPVHKTDDIDASFGHVGPGMSIYSNAFPEGGVSHEQWKAIDSGKDALWLTGIVRYRDAFGKRRSYEFCQFSRSRTDATFTIHSKHNHAD